VNAFHVIGILFAAWAVLVSFLGIRREGFPASRGQALGVGAISIVLCVGAIGAAVITSAAEEEEGEEAAEPAAAEGGPNTLRLSADSGGGLSFDKDTLEARAGEVTLVMENPSSLQHNVSIEGRGVDEEGNTVGEGGTSTVRAELRPGEYQFYCSVTGHRDGGMEGTLTVR
jgi:plastocyanin